MCRLLPTLDTTGGGEEATDEMSCVTYFKVSRREARSPSFCMLRRCPARCVRHPMDWEAGAVAGARAVGGGRWGAVAVAVGNEDRHAAFFLTTADEKNKPEFCKSDPRRRRGWG